MFRVVGTQEAEAWNGYLNALPEDQRDIHWSLELARVQEDAFGSKAGLLVSTLNGAATLQPFVVDQQGVMRHAFNFGGPIGAPNPEFFDAVQAWKCFSGIKGEASTLNPMHAQAQRALLGTSIPAALVKEAVYLDLAEPFAFRDTHRQVIAKAKRDGVRAEKVVADQKHLAIFASMYLGTMLRRQAKAHWHFPSEYFHLNVGHLREKLALFLSLVDGEPEGGAIVIADHGIAYYHYAGSFNQHPKCGAAPLLIETIAQWAKDAGNHVLFLGGGVEANDGLFQFKAGFSKLRAPVYSYRIG